MLKLCSVCFVTSSLPRSAHTKPQGSVRGDAGRRASRAGHCPPLSHPETLGNHIPGREIRVTCAELLCGRELHPAFVSAIRHPRIPTDPPQLLASRMSAVARKILFHLLCPIPDENSLKAAASAVPCYCWGTRLSVASYYCRHRIICTKAQDQKKWFKTS